jgi:hypothetical protein
MKRKDFIKSIALLSGANFVLGCKFVDLEGTRAISVEEAQKWVNGSYLPKYALTSAKLTEIPAKYKRKVNWEDAVNQLNGQIEFVFAPIKYENEFRPGVIIDNGLNLWKLNLPELYNLNIVEGLVIYKNQQQEIDAFLTQLCYDPLDLKLYKNGILRLDNFTGYLISSDWNDHPLEVISMKDGVSVESNGIKNPNGRVSECTSFTVQYNSVTVSSCGPSCIEATYTVYTVRVATCTSSPGPFAFNSGQSSSSIESVKTYSSFSYPVYGSNTIPSTTPVPPPYDVYDAITNASGTSRTLLNKKLNDVMSAVGLSTSISGWSLDKATALTKTIGGTLGEVTPIVTVAGKALGFTSLFVGSVQLYAYVIDHGGYDNPALLTDRVFLEQAASTALSAVGVAMSVGAITVSSPWIAVGVGATSLVLGIASSL